MAEADNKSAQSRKVGGKRPGAGRPKGARNKCAAELKAMLEPLDAAGVERLKKIIARGSNKEAVEALRLAWEYRHGKPKQGIDLGGSVDLPMAVPMPAEAFATVTEQWIEMFRPKPDAEPRS